MKIVCGRTIDYIQQELDISRSVIKRTLKLWWETGEVLPHKDPQKEKRLRIMTDNEIHVSSVGFIFDMSWSHNHASLVPFHTYGAEPRYVSR
jgi:hypothetical protein